MLVHQVLGGLVVLLDLVLESLGVFLDRLLLALVLLGLRLEIQPGILVRLVACHRRDALHEIEDARGLIALFCQHCLDDFCRLRLAEATLA